MLVEGTFRGWSQLALQRAAIGFRSADSETFQATRDNVALVFLPCDPGVGWGLSPDGLGDLLHDGADEVWAAVFAHDTAHYELGWFRWAEAAQVSKLRHEHDVLVSTGRREQVRQQRKDELQVIGRGLQRSLGRLASHGDPRDAQLRGDAEAAFVSLAARLGPTLPAWLDDGHGRNAMLRVCELTGIVFRATCRARFHPALPRQAKRVGRLNVRRVGTRFPPAEPFAPYAREVWSSGLCDHCGETFETRHRGRVYCSDKCKVAASRAVHAA